ncbi:LADA_0F09934g1_1 [Lachancea dasiensis]|uniref:Ribosomal RNA-processing protein 41 n=1 Tax=Lachancea dasiensis TaxID=1072105 RepID=A0A1G4JLF0_9SACH|nr:LADA_0F09934g1_1 [Lachancea dasiensis]
MSRLEIYSPEGLRVDGRRWNELRRLECSINTHTSASDGSSYLEQGNNKIITLVNGPQEPKLRSQMSIQKATISVAINITRFSKMERSKTSHRNERRVLEMQTALVRTFEKNVQLHLYPRTQIDIQIHVLQQDGGLMGSLINGITLALIDAGIAMYDYISGVSVGLYDTTPLLDLNSVEESSMSSVTLGVVGKSEKLSLLLVEDKIPLDRMESVLAIGIAGSHRIRELMDRELRKHGRKRLSNVSSNN